MARTLADAVDYAVKTRDGVWACYDVSGEYMGVSESRPPKAKDLRSASARVASAIKMDAGKRGRKSVRIEEGGSLTSRAAHMFAKLAP